MNLLPEDDAVTDRQQILGELRASQTGPEARYESLVRLLRSSLGCPVVWLGLHDDTTIWLKGEAGLGRSRLPLSALPLPADAQQLPVVDRIEESELDLLLEDAPEPGQTLRIRAALSIDVRVAGQAIGRLCAMDVEPRRFDSQAHDTLREAATVASALLQSAVIERRSRRHVARVRAAGLSSSDWLWESDEQGAVVWVSSGVEAHTGLPRTSGIGRTIGEINRPSPNDTTNSWERYREARLRLEPFRDVIAERDTPQGMITVSISGVPTFDSQGRFRGYRGTTSNITERMEAQASARKAERLLSDALDSLTAGVMISDPQGRVVLTNPIWRRNLTHHMTPGITWEELVRKMAEDGNYPEVKDREAFVRWRISLPSEKGELHEIRWRNRWVIVSDRLLPDGSVVHLSIDITDRKRAELALADQQALLRESRAQLAAVLDAVPDRWFVLDSRARFLECSGPDHPMLHRPWDEVRGQPFHAAAPRALADRVVAAVAQALRSGQVQRLDYDLIAADGMARIFEARVSPMPDQRVLYVTRDVTDQTRAADKLRLSEELYRSVAAAISDGLLVVTPALAIIAINPAGCAILGVEHAKVVGLNGGWPFELLDAQGKTLPFDQHPVSRVVASGQPLIGQVHALRRPDTQRRWIELNAHPLQLRPEGSTFSVVLTFRDVSQQRAAEQALVTAEERWKFALEGSGDGVWDWNVRSNRIFYSTRWKQMLGFADAEIGDTVEEWTSRIHHDDVTRVLGDLRRHLRGETAVYQSEHRVRHRDGHYLWMLDRGKVVSQGPDGQPHRVVGTQSDITRGKEAEQMQRDKQAAELASRAKSEFLSRMSHEMRTPLNAVIGFSQLLGLQQGALQAEMVRDYAGHVQSAGEHLLALIDEVLDLQKIEEGALTLALGAVDLHAEVARAQEFLWPMAQSRQIRFENDLSARAWVHADAQRLRQVLLNVASNGIKYNRPGGTLRWCTAEPVDGRLTLSIQDSGAGMNAEQMSRLFQPFERLGRETSTIEGTGLGLIISRSLVQAIGGKLEVTSEPGKGTCVSIELQCAEAPGQEVPTAPAPLDEPAAPEPEPQANTLRMLYVEDNRINAILFEEAMRLHAGHIELRVAEDGDQAIAMASSWQPQVLVLDAHLPGISGFEVLQQLRALPGLDTVPAYMCSADAMPEDVQRAYEAGFIGYWTKPINVGSVVADVSKWVPRPRQDAFA